MFIAVLKRYTLVYLKFGITVFTAPYADVI